MTLARAKAGSTQTQSLLVPPYHLDVVLRSAHCSGPTNLLDLRGDIQICRFRGEDLLATITSVSALFPRA